MCGIIGYIGSQVEGRDAVGKGLAVLRHRGPDDTHIVQYDNVTLGHTRLSIIDKDTGAQPIVNDGIAIVVNGEFYDYQQIMQRCCASGYKPLSKSDSEILIPIYLKYGLDGMFATLNGEFTFIIHDRKRRRVIAARDRFGIKPLCWYTDNHRTIIASEAKAILAMGIDRRIDRYSFMHAATMQYQPTQGTMFDGIKQVAPGHLLIIDDRGIKDVCYWDINFPAETHERSISLNDAVLLLHHRLTYAVKQRLIADVPVCCHLSGGLDSSAVAGIASRVYGKRLDCFTIAFDYATDEYDEGSLARETAKYCGSQLYTVNVSQTDILDNLSDAVYYSEGLAVNGHISCKYLLNKAIHAHGYRVALTGEGADECLVGYSHLRHDAFTALGKGKGSRLIDRLYATNAGVVGVEIPLGDSLNLDSVERRLGFVPSFLRAKASIGAKVYEVLSADMLDQCQKHDFFDDMLNRYDIAGQLASRHRINQSLYLWTKLTLANYILGTLGDGCEMAASVEGRLPFLDSSVYEIGKSLPIDYKLRDGNEKYLLKEAVRPYITDTVYRRQKHPFQSPPITQYLDKAQLQRIIDTLSTRRFIEANLFDVSKITNLLTRIKDMDINHQTAYEPVIMLALTLCHLTERYKL